ncbi:HNH endonuclease [Photobacterium sp. DNB22_13_2]
MIWAVYVSDKPHSKINFPIGMDSRVWGVTEDKKKTVLDVKEGDLVAFVYAISWLKAEGPPPSGFSRVGKDKLDLFRGVVQNITLGKVTRSYYESHSVVWPDDTYPHRFEFEIVEQRKGNVFFGTEFFNSEFVEAVRYSACTRGSVTAASSIVELEDLSPKEDKTEQYTIDDPGYEGQPIYRLHKTRERDDQIPRRKKDQVLNEVGRLACEICDTDFYKAYGELGYGFAECHHENPISLRDKNEETNLKDLAILCANCHRMIHRKKPWLSVKELKAIYEEHRD